MPPVDPRQAPAARPGPLGPSGPKLLGSASFFRLWLAQVVSSLGDWIGLFAILTLTASGMDVYRQIVPLVQAVEAEMLAALSPDDRQGLDAALARIEAYLDRTLPAPVEEPEEESAEAE